MCLAMGWRRIEPSRLLSRAQADSLVASAEISPNDRRRLSPFAGGRLRTAARKEQCCGNCRDHRGRGHRPLQTVISVPLHGDIRIAENSVGAASVRCGPKTNCKIKQAIETRWGQAPSDAASFAGHKDPLDRFILPNSSTDNPAPKQSARIINTYSRACYDVPLQ